MIRKGFTLAEVLITLAIIGIVAAVTIPTLVQNYKKKVVETKLLRVYSVMNNAIKLSTVENGDTTTWKGINDRSFTYEDVLAWFEKYLGKYIKYSKTEPDGNNLLLYFMDGSILGINYYIYDMSYYLDEKSLENPKYGQNTFRFRFQPYQTATKEFDILRTQYSINSGFEPYSYGWDGTIDGVKYDSFNHDTRKYGCYDDNGYTENGSLCTKLIQLNGWKIPDDYPYKF